MWVFEEETNRNNYKFDMGVQSHLLKLQLAGVVAAELLGASAGPQLREMAFHIQASEHAM